MLSDLEFDPSASTKRSSGRGPVTFTCSLTPIRHCLVVLPSAVVGADRRTCKLKRHQHYHFQSVRSDAINWTVA
jgi:hypothetical protein